MQNVKATFFLVISLLAYFNVTIQHDSASCAIPSNVGFYGNKTNKRCMEEGGDFLQKLKISFHAALPITQPLSGPNY